ncbi:probable 4-hydroxybenzoyl CoA thioesterase [Pseudooceanicola batsensis HTCC2597]|uniref:Probable 4-hydroxybenzoyl CoA thioesterase n=1 Tax=Pseudooceanicola batsensis (strain ATCC BAA-863 / DSM 15984 / KCTC 12145 / HTCC2597) TaxID=252305 RepID=A3TUF6_PSEBH|nr:thioesterase family protein [Pseudooceanicola batsensis]EAQ04152.1 probable 4-hydroxybenzoyl CoA thioesterase [Pseudooceanicola batsensis HTCC2597]
MPAFAHRNAVMFQHCDPAGIVFYPRYFEMINEVVEVFFARALGWSFRQMHMVERLGVPMRRLATDFHAASRLGDELDWSLAVTRIGGASAEIEIRAACESEARLTARGTLVLVDLDRMTSTRWPEGRRATLESYAEDRV